MIASEQKENVNPICPHCKMELKTVWFRQVQSMLGKRYVYFCPNCRATLGFSHRKGFWMG